MELFVTGLPPLDLAHFRSATLPNLDIVNPATRVRTSTWGAAFWQAFSNSPRYIRGLSLPLSNPVLTRCIVTIFTAPVGLIGLEPESRRGLRESNSRIFAFQIGERAQGDQLLRVWLRLRT